VAADDERYGFDDRRRPFAERLGRLVPQSVCRRAIRVDLRVDKHRYRSGEPVAFEVTMTNRLPLPIVVATPRPRLWGWTVDGELEASDESAYPGDAPGSLAFRSRERRTLRHEWSGAFKRVGERTRWVTPEPGDHELRAFLATDPPVESAPVTIRIE
jgi:hypothetical protein